MSKLVPNWRKPWWHFRWLRFALWCKIASLGAKLLVKANRRAGNFIEFCVDCQHRIDPEVCHCGLRCDEHWQENHTAVPMGCTCSTVENWKAW